MNTLRNILIFGLLVAATSGRAALPPTRAEREDYVDTRLTKLSLSPTARRVLDQSSWWAKQTVATIVTMDAVERRAAVGREQWLEREVLRDLRARDLRFDLTGEELRRFVVEGVSPRVGLASKIDIVAWSPGARHVLAAAKCRTLGDIRERLSMMIIYGAPPLTEALARELRQLRHLDVEPGQEVLTPSEGAFAAALAEARLGRNARRVLRDNDVRTFDGLRALPLARIAARDGVGRKVVAQIESLERTKCAARLTRGM